MSENPVRKASEEAAKEMWVLKNTSSVPSEIQSQMADIIESKFAPVVAAAEEAMKEKCAGIADKMKEENRTARKRNPDDADILQAAEYEVEACAAKIRAIPTGTALAEYTEDAAGQALARMFYLIEHPDEIVPVSETSYYTNDYAIAFRELIERAKAGWRAGMQPKLDYLNNGWRERDEYIASLKAQLAEAARKLFEIQKELQWFGEAKGAYNSPRMKAMAESVATMRTALSAPAKEETNADAKSESKSDE